MVTSADILKASARCSLANSKGNRQQGVVTNVALAANVCCRLAKQLLRRDHDQGIDGRRNTAVKRTVRRHSFSVRSTSSRESKPAPVAACPETGRCTSGFHLGSTELFPAFSIQESRSSSACNSSGLGGSAA